MTLSCSTETANGICAQQGQSHLILFLPPSDFAGNSTLSRWDWLWVRLLLSNHVSSNRLCIHDRVVHRTRPDNYYFMIILSWWLWMIIAIQGERVGFFFEKWKLYSLSLSSHFSLKTPHLWHTYKKKKHPPLFLLLQRSTTLMPGPNSYNRRSSMLTADRYAGREGGCGGLALRLLVNWKLGRPARNLPKIPIDRGILHQGGRAGIRMARSMTAIFNTAGGQGPTVTETVRAKL